MCINLLFWKIWRRGLGHYSANLAESRGMLLTRLEAIPAGQFNDGAIQETVLETIRSKDFPLAARILREVVYRATPWVDLDGRLLSLWYLEAAQEASKNGDESLRDHLREALRLLTYTLHNPNTGESAVAAARFILPQTFPQILDLADVRLAEAWMEAVHARRALHDLRPSFEAVELIISRVLIRRREWGLVTKWIQEHFKNPAYDASTAQSHRYNHNLQQPSTALFTELFQSVMHQQDSRHSKFILGQPTADEQAYLRLQECLQLLADAGVRLEGNAADALESILASRIAPTSFLDFLSELAQKQQLLQQPQQLTIKQD